MDALQQFRKEKDEFFKHHNQSPLTSEQRNSFEGLKYFPENHSLRLEIAIEEFPEKDQIQFQTSTGESRYLTRFGKIYFQVDGENAELTIYDDGHGLFLPFVDSLANEETYGAGRYLEPEQLPNGKHLIDFNIAYNPYCAYNDLFSCPLTPWENRLTVPIRAGEKIFEKYPDD